jgi:hypothetical protein
VWDDGGEGELDDPVRPLGQIELLDLPLALEGVRGERVIDALLADRAVHSITNVCMSDWAAFPGSSSRDVEDWIPRTFLQRRAIEVRQPRSWARSKVGLCRLPTRV